MGIRVLFPLLVRSCSINGVSSSLVEYSLILGASSVIAVISSDSDQFDISILELLFCLDTGHTTILSSELRLRKTIPI